jgi:hypothetical protein
VLYKQRMAKFYRDIKRLIEEVGCTFHKKGKGDHEIWLRPDGKKFTADKGCNNRHTANGTLKDAGLEKAF